MQEGRTGQRGYEPRLYFRSLSPFPLRLKEENVRRFIAVREALPALKFERPGPPFLSSCDPMSFPPMFSVHFTALYPCFTSFFRLSFFMERQYCIIISTRISGSTFAANISASSAVPAALP